MDTVTITLNGREVSGSPGMTILDLARESGITIPTLCHDPNLPAYGACRICVVEDERNGALVASCVTPIAPGMIVNTQSQKVKERRATLLKLMLASHPDTCMVCDKGNCCELRNIASDLGIGFIDFQRIPQKAVIQEVNPFIQRDLSKCILCGKCIRADQELVVEGAIDYLHRGFTSKPATVNDQPLEKSECTFCGTCVAMCPTGALSEKDKVYWGTTHSTVSSICPYCGCGCGISLHVKDNRLIRSLPDTQSPINRGTLCVRGSYGYDFVHSQERLILPLVKADGELKDASWDQAIELIVKEFERIRKEHGPDSLAVFGSSKCTNEENYLLQKLARCVLGTNNIDNGSRLFNKSDQIYPHSFSNRLEKTATIDDLDQSKLILVIGANPTISTPLVGYAIKRALKYRGAKLLLINPLQTRLSMFAHIWLRPKVGTDTSLLLGMAKVIIDEGLMNKETSYQKTEDFTKLCNSLQNYSITQVEMMTGIDKQDIQKAARFFMSANKVSIVYGNGISQQVNASEAIIAIEYLMRLSGDSQVNIFPLQRENNALGACDMGSLPDYLPGYQSLNNTSERTKFENYWKCKLPTNKGFTTLEMISNALKGAIKGLYIVGENPALSFPQPGMVQQALQSLDFLVVQDMFLTETAKLATVVLPASSFAENEGSYTNFEGRVQRLNRAIMPVDGSLPDWEIIANLSSAMGYPMTYSSPSQVMLEIKDLVPLYSEINFEAGNVKNHPNISKKFNGNQLSDISHDFTIEEYNTGINPDRDYPFTLITGSSLYGFGSGTRSIRATRLKKYSTGAIVEINKQDADSNGIGDGDQVKISSCSGEITATAKITDTAGPGLAFMPLACNSVMSLFNFDASNKASLKTCAVRLERINNGD